mgnify:CR=1 FL=1
MASLCRGFAAGVVVVSGLGENRYGVVKVVYEFAYERVVVKQVRMGGGVAEGGVGLKGVSPEAEFVTYGHESYELLWLVFHKAHGVLAVIPAVGFCFCG